MASQRPSNQPPFWQAVHRAQPGRRPAAGRPGRPSRPVRREPAPEQSTDAGTPGQPHSAPAERPRSKSGQPFRQWPRPAGRPGPRPGPGEPATAQPRPPRPGPGGPAAATPRPPRPSPGRPAGTQPRPPLPGPRRHPASQRPRPAPVSAEPGPETDDTLPTLYLRPGEADRILAGHPWVYESSILRETRPATNGEVVQVKDHRRRLLGVGFYNAQSKIRVRVLSSERIEIDEAFFERRIAAAVEHRRRFLPEATSYRVVNAEGDLLSGLIVDRYEDVLVVQTSSLGMDQRKTLITRVLERQLQPRAILERNDMGARKFEGLPESSGVLAGTITDAELAAVPVRLNGITFEANLLAGHKTGLYLDQQVNHARVAQLARGARVLDAFSFIGGFALPAARAGAASVLGLDQSEEAVALARRLAASHALADQCTFEATNVFDWLRQRAAPETAEAGLPPEALFDLIILDPPSFTRNRASVPDALRGYKEIHLRALRLLRPGGILATFCCSHHVDALMFEAVIRESAFDARRALRRVATYTQSPDHPVLPAVPETEYLKGFAFETLGA